MKRVSFLAYLKTIRAFCKGRISNKEAYDSIAKIFGDENQDLLDEFELHLGVNGGRKKIKKKKKAARGKSTRRKRIIFLQRHQNNCPICKGFDDLDGLNDTAASEAININKYFSALRVSAAFGRIQRTRLDYYRKTAGEDPKYVLPQILSRLGKEEELVESRGKLHKR
ncbi:hypothetical protein HAX54_035940 [Datura stramonium]|uniref:Uncharacterized protein n=1 Tax=Datura stramonium TaxID=4076 RepID=A0ABS8SFN2_DATST|nr:hypothetical protein [Datura stramonium]